MLKRKRTWILLALLLTLGVGVYFEPSHCVRGWLFSEAFFEGRPTSYWRTIVVRDLRNGLVILGEVPWPPPNRFERWLGSVGYQPETAWSGKLIDKAAAPVLRELAADEWPAVAGFAQDVLDYPHPQPTRDLVNPDLFFWMNLIRKHNLQQRPTL